MSAINTRNKANSIESVSIPAGAIVVGACLFGLVKGLSFLANAAIENAQAKPVTANTQNLQSVAAIRAEAGDLKVNTAVNKELADLKIAAFRQLATAPFLVESRTEIEKVIVKLDCAGTISEFKTVHREAVAKLESGHQRIFSTALLDAGKRAALKIGFAKIESLPSSLSSVARFAATDSSGKTIVTEINAPIGGDTRIETEVIGVSDGSCNQILDAFDAALEAEGVRSQPASRKFTGGVCELSAVRDFVNRKIALPTTDETETEDFTGSNDVKRRQRLNRNRQGQKQK